MSFSRFFDVVIGLTFLFLTCSVFCSSLSEWIANFLGTRGKFLEAQLKQLVAHPELLAAMKSGPFLSPFFKLAVTPASDGMAPANAARTPPNWLDGQHFADSFLWHLVEQLAKVMPADAASQLANTLPLKFDEVYSLISTGAKLADQTPPDPKVFDLDSEKLRAEIRLGNVAKSVLPMMVNAENSLEQVRKNLVNWYDNTMDQASVSYKNNAHVWLFVIGLIFAVLFNIDTNHVARTLWSDPLLREAVVNAGSHALDSGAGETPQNVDNYVNTLNTLENSKGFTLPVGREIPLQQKPDTQPPAGQKAEQLSAFGEFNAVFTCWLLPYGLISILGWLITALGISMGAPFWFDLLNKIVSLRNATKRE